MRFVPYVNHTIEVELPVDLVVESLSKETQQKRPFWPNPFSDNRKQFIGSVSSTGTFQLVRNIYYLNSFLPSIRGRVTESMKGTVVSCSMIGNPAVIAAFMALPAFAGFILTTLMMETRFFVWVASVFGLFVGYCIYTFGFMVHQGIDKKALTDVLTKKS